LGERILACGFASSTASCPVSDQFHFPSATPSGYGVQPIMRIFLNGLGASAGGGLTYLANVLPHLAAAGEETTVAIGTKLQIDGLDAEGIRLLRMGGESSPGSRFWTEQTRLRRAIQDSGADVLISAGNFALRNSPVPQILLSRNSLYTCSNYY